MHLMKLLASAVRTATSQVTTDEWGNALNLKGGKGVKVIVDFTAVPGVDTVTPSIEYQDAISGKWITAITGAARSTTGTVELTVYPGIAESANVKVSNVIPAYAPLRVTFTHSAASSFTYSASIAALP